MMSGESGVPQFKSFVSESEIEEKKRKRQEEWEKVRTADQPVEAPEEEYDPRSLYERLQEQKDKKQAEFEEQFKAKNQVRGLDDDEAQFLDFVSDRAQELEKQREMEDFEVIREYKKAVVKTADVVPEDKPAASKSKPSSSQNRKSQLQLLSGAVKRKKSENDAESPDKKLKSCNENSESKTDESLPKTGFTGYPSCGASKVVAILPGLGQYDESSGSDSASSDSEVDDSQGDLPFRGDLVISPPISGFVLGPS